MIYKKLIKIQQRQGVSYACVYNIISIAECQTPQKWVKMTHLWAFLTIF